MPRKPNASLTQAELGRAIGITQSLASRYVRQGMPADDIEAARTWMRRNVAPRAKMYQAPPVADMVVAASVLARLSTQAAEFAYRRALGKNGCDDFARALVNLLFLLPEDRALAVHLPDDVQRLIDSDLLWDLRRFTEAGS